jgi:hypothetical protein
VSCPSRGTDAAVVMMCIRYMSADSICGYLPGLCDGGGGATWYVLLVVQELDFDLGSGFAGKVRALDVYDQYPMYSSCNALVWSTVMC